MRSRIWLIGPDNELESREYMQSANLDDDDDDEKQQREFERDEREEINTKVRLYQIYKITYFELKRMGGPAFKQISACSLTNQIHNNICLFV